MRFRAFRVDWDTLFFRKFSWTSRWVKRGKKKFFFLHFYAFQSILSRLRHTFFSNIFVSAKRETRASKASEMRAQSAKPEGAKRPSSLAGLAGKSAERACKLVSSIDGATWFCAKCALLAFRDKKVSYFPINGASVIDEEVFEFC